MHIAINAQLVSFSETYRNAGVSRYTYRLIEGLEGLAADGDDQRFSVFVSAQDRAAVAHFDHGPVRLLPSHQPTTQPLQRIMWEQSALPGLLRRLRVDVFHSPVNVLPLRRLPCASVVTIHDLAFVHYPHFYRPARRLYQRFFTAHSARHATLVIADSQSTRRDIITYFDVNPNNVRVVYPAIEPRFKPVADPTALAEFRADHGLPEHFLLYLATLEPRKNAEGLVRAYAQLRTMEPDAPPLILAGGKGWYYDTLFALVRELGIERSVTFAGYVRDEEQPLWYAAADLFIYPSLFEGFGLPVAEAMACGAPVITSNVSSLPEVAGDVAIQVDPRDPALLAHAMQRLMRSEEERRRLAAEGPPWAARFSITTMVRECRDIYLEAAQTARGQRGKRLVEVG